MTPRSNALAETVDAMASIDKLDFLDNKIIRLSEEDFLRSQHGEQEETPEEFYRRTAAGGKLDAGRTVRSGLAYDFDSTEPVEPRDAERAAGIKAELGDEPLHGIEKRYVYRFVKRAFDIVFSAAVIVTFSWLFIIIAIAVKVDDPKGPVFFKQQRVTNNERLFYMYKFRSMCVDAEEKLAELQELNEKSGPVFKITDDPRITRVGKWIRKLSFDELPQFFNALVVDMSVVGPRPALPTEVKTYTEYQRQRLLVQGGIRPSILGELADLTHNRLLSWEYLSTFTNLVNRTARIGLVMAA